ncbi:MAG: Gx transporter family protein [Spirochaetaceae bacterium]|jgi:heptaprenyl diphosphate synthase|nr:Gx transporter family protein [Spirochaetaceae bacterium]
MPPPGDSKKTLAALGAFCLFLSTIEYMIPKPLPFLRLGLANVPLILALHFPLSFFATLVAVKVLAQALISGTLFSYVFLFSLAGTTASSLLMFLLARLFHRAGSRRGAISFVGISVAGAFLSNITQIALARFIILGESALYIAPPFLLMGMFTGFLLGLFAEKFTQQSVWCASGAFCPRRHYGASGALMLCLQYEKGAIPLGSTSPLGSDTPRRTPHALPLQKKFTKEVMLFIIGVILSITLLFIPWTSIRIALFLIFWIIAAVRGRAGNPLITLLVFAAIVLCNMLSPYGKVIFSIASFDITEGALLGALKKAATIEGLIMLSKITISDTLRLPGVIGSTIAESFRIVRILNENKKKIDLKRFINWIDEMLIRAETL